MRRSTIVAGSVATALIAANASPAWAQEMGTGDDLSPTGKGIAGCALLGAEAVLLIEAAAGLDAAWAYIVFPILGAAAGGVGGFLIEDADQPELAVASLALGVALIIPTTVLVLSATSYDPEDEDDGGTEEDEGAAETELESAEDAEGGGGSGTRIERPAESGGGEAGGTTPAPTTTPTPAPTGGTGATGGGGGAPQSRLHRSSRSRRPHATGVVGGALVSARADNGFSLGLGVPAISVTGLYSAREQATLAQLGIRAGGTEVRIDLLRLAF